MSSSRSQIPWDKIGIEVAAILIPACDVLSREFGDALSGVDEPGIPAFDDPKWRYEYCILSMFWVWYVANSPTYRNAEGTKPLLDAYWGDCCKEMIRARLIKNNEEGVRRWEDDLEERCQVYKNAYDQQLADRREEPHLPLRGTVGWAFALYLFPHLEPNFKLVLLINELESFRFLQVVEFFKDPAGHYYAGNPSRKFWKWK